MTIPDGMITAEDTVDEIKKLQENDLNENIDYRVMQQQETQLNNISNRQNELIDKLQLLYGKLDAVKNHEEFTDLLANNSSLLREIFTMESCQRSESALNHRAPNIDWSKYGLDIEDYIADDEELLALRNRGLL